MKAKPGTDNEINQTYSYYLSLPKTYRTMNTCDNVNVRRNSISSNIPHWYLQFEKEVHQILLTLIIQS